jgi:hypothetical protein
MFVAGVQILHDNPQLPIAKPVSCYTELRMVNTYPSTHSPEMSASDFDLFPVLTVPLLGKLFKTIEEVSDALSPVITQIVRWYPNRIKDLPKFCATVIKFNGDHFKCILFTTRSQCQYL